MIENIKVSENDLCTVKPIQGRSIQIKLNRMSYELKSTTADKVVYDDFKLSLPGPKSHIYHLKIYRNKSGYFIVESLLETPFIINGKEVYKTFVYHNDELQLGYNIITFYKSDQLIKRKKYGKSYFDNFEKISLSKMSILLEGETGTGKSYLAKKIHDKSLCRGEFVHINLSSYSYSLIESEIFGHKEGAFTGAICDQKGALLKANNGTLFLDEVDSLPKNIQTKLLLFLDTNTFQPVGSDKIVKSNCRLITASGQSLKEIVKEKKMRNDFYFRISSGIRWKLAPISQTPFVIKRIIQDYEISNHIIFDKKLIDYYLTLNWPGNIRQLNGHLDRKKNLSNNNYIKFNNLDLELTECDDFFLSEARVEKFISMKDVKLQYTYSVYNRLQENISRTSKVLDISSNTVRLFVEQAKDQLQLAC